MSNLQFVPTKDNSYTLFNPELNETYHSIHGAITESKHVFIKNGLQHFFEINNKKNIRVLEVGFGTGLNALLSYLYCTTEKKSLNYISCEPFPLSNDLIQQLNYPDQLNINQEEYKFYLELHTQKKVNVLSNNISIKMDVITIPFQKVVFTEKVDVIFFDAFAPSKQPEMWFPEVFLNCYDLLEESGFLVTYCAKGEVKRTLKSVGFKVETLPGPPGKREMIRAIK
jgi:tRNA U34 5-methylaminomethyl-2-thiouridine-forming methyltransferase MnmC